MIGLVFVAGGFAVWAVGSVAVAGLARARLRTFPAEWRAHPEVAAGLAGVRRPDVRSWLRRPVLAGVAVTAVICGFYRALGATAAFELAFVALLAVLVTPTQIARGRKRGRELAVGLPPYPRASRRWRAAWFAAYFALTAGFLAVAAGIGILVVAPFV